MYQALFFTFVFKVLMSEDIWGYMILILVYLLNIYLNNFLTWICTPSNCFAANILNKKCVLTFLSLFCDCAKFDNLLTVGFSCMIIILFCNISTIYELLSMKRVHPVDRSAKTDKENIKFIVTMTAISVVYITFSTPLLVRTLISMQCCNELECRSNLPVVFTSMKFCKFCTRLKKITIVFFSNSNS